ncbi:plant regulator RWP-RK family protein [Actinidia rufa]|uniref:Plant regulator RWP-RK family protein n=1 Tax=Actinidia rufa TaxID=165716 RepID=A0A7J0FSX8_9ERIC|nr:plant regulator RWP-RK family protein [Actinidia rufa]
MGEMLTCGDSGRPVLSITYKRDKGLLGGPLRLHNSCFCEYITQLCKTEYPLVHYARMFGLTSSFAICLRSSHTGNDDYILEFFLPPHIRDHRDQQTLLDTILVTMKQHFWNILVASGNELEEEGRCIEIIKASMDEKLDSGLRYDQISQSAILPPHLELDLRQLDSSEEQLFVEFDDATKSGEKVASGGKSYAAISHSKMKNVMETRERVWNQTCNNLRRPPTTFWPAACRCGKILGVSVATFKRRCRHNGITWWNSDECFLCFKPFPKHCEPPDPHAKHHQLED